MVTGENAIESATPSQKNESHHSAGHASSSDLDGSTPVVPKRPSEDGYSWRKYGQKNVKRNEYIRSYYRCSHQNCLVKKQVEHAHDGRITDTTYFGEHEHPKPQNNIPITVPSVVSVNVQIADSHSVPIAEDKSTAVALKSEQVEPKGINKLAIVVTSSEGGHEAPPPPIEAEDDAKKNDKLVVKRRKKGIDDGESIVDKPGNQACYVVETVSVVDIVNDGYRWRKYGQKLVKGNLNPRSYYRCSNPGCPAKKHVERAFRDPKVVITTYEGKHDHDIPPVRTMLPHGNLPLSPSEPNGVKKSNKPDQSLVPVAQDDVTGSKKQEDDNSHHIAEEKKDAPTDTDAGTLTHDSSGLEIGSSEQQTPDGTALVISCQEKDPKERQNPDSEPVSC